MRPTVNGLSSFVQSEVDLQRLAVYEAGLGSTGAHLLRELVEDLDIVLNVDGVVLGGHRHIAERLAVDDSLGVLVCKFRRGPV